MNAYEVCTLAPVVPVLTVANVAEARPLAKALVAGGLPALEVTLRTSCALEAIKEMADVEGGVVGAGTLLSSRDIEAAKKAGARFGVSPGVTPALLDAAQANELPLLPGVSTASEAMMLLDRGIDVMKFFPAEAAGGARFLKSLSAPLSAARFCPTGGVSLSNMNDYLSLPNVLCVGGSWVAPKDVLVAGDWDEVESLAREARDNAGAKG